MSEILSKFISKDMRVVDLTQPISSHTSNFDSNPKAFHYELLSSLEKDGCAAGAFHIEEHFGTHMDAPIHFVSGGLYIDQLPADRLVVPAVVMDIQGEVSKDQDYQVTADKIQLWEKQVEIAEGSAFLLMTGWSQHYKNPERYCNRDEEGRLRFPSYSEQAAKYLVQEKHVAIIGIDTLSADYGLSEDFAVHKIALSNDVYIIENLCNLDKLPASGALLFCGPLPIEGGTGSPARVLAVVA
jgi:kynurenine formamidase